jgi:hypothetical protein
MKTLADQIEYLGHDLNPQRVASLEPDAEKLHEEVQELGKAIDATRLLGRRPARIAAPRVPRSGYQRQEQERREDHEMHRSLHQVRAAGAQRNWC